ncbi:MULTISPECIES: benzoate/H(+) symporter BenE family transporter [unclassified Streptomyces]|uniref:benzoate/H(+) symporter BenE family transporter n=1 Tax=unclassified Streptomyces TaxID=2593676 RepID=UPI002E2E0EC9|nr:benzoate/H(+) symporter BenE family transporter [Streptomyces sp. NBC_00223]
MAQAVSAGVVAAVVGFAGSFALVLTGLHAVGADSRQAVSALLTLCVAMGLLSAWFAVRHRQPISIAWSTPGAAMLAAVGGHSGGYRYAVGAFAVAGVSYAVSGASERVRRALAAIPPGVATAILAGILLPLCLAPIRAVATMPDLAGPVLVVWALALRWARRWQVPLALLTAIAVVLVERPLPHLTAATVLPEPTFTLPAFSVGALVGLALPLYIVTMASQNVPGLAVLAHYGYRPPTRSVLLAGGTATALGSFSGAFSLNLAASTAALMVGPGSHADPRKRWIASLSAGAAYLVFGAAAGMFAVLLGAAPALLFQAVAGLALLGTFASAMTTTLTGSADATAGVAAFLTTASGVSAWQIGSPFWGLLVGLAVHFLLPRAPVPVPAPAPAVTPSARQPAARQPSVPEPPAADRR